ncbi:resistance-nodulation-cell division acriflavin:proton (H+) antiporter [Listeria fleischmannii subsp. coloradonensis]|uniref:MMPL family transporter n=1 Tax=Listeria fleischmannii TaxID=1069827 RepID=UPI000254F29B|nr:resistance-nodulation-cell division acriflavin:proton (H+) antiporter [Listeria fleischmannii subsp. coloradonensis]
MAKLLFHLGQTFAKHRWKTIFGWLIVLGIILATLGINGIHFSDDIKMNGLKSLDTSEKIGQEFKQDSQKGNIRIVFQTKDKKGIVQPENIAQINQALNKISIQKHVVSASNPYESKTISQDMTTAFADLTYDVDYMQVNEKMVGDVKDALKPLHKAGIQTELTGNVMISPMEIGGTSEVIGIIVALIILVVTFGSLIAAGLPILSALVSLGASIGIVAILSSFIDMPNVTLTLAVMIGLAVGIDYALFILFKYRQIIRTEKDPIKAVGLATGTAGSAVIFAGITVIIAVCGLSLVGIDFLAVMGFASAISVLFAVLSALILMPAFIGLLRCFIGTHFNASTRKEDTLWTKFVIGKPLIVFLCSNI